MCWLTVDVRYLFSTKALNPKDSEMADTLSREIFKLISKIYEFGIQLDKMVY